MASLQKVKKRLDELTKRILDSKKEPDAEDCQALAAELKMLRELIATWKAYGAIEDADFDDGTEVTREKRVAQGSWDD